MAGRKRSSARWGSARIPTVWARRTSRGSPSPSRFSASAPRVTAWRRRLRRQRCRGPSPRRWSAGRCPGWWCGGDSSTLRVARAVSSSSISRSGSNQSRASWTSRRGADPVDVGRVGGDQPVGVGHRLEGRGRGCGRRCGGPGGPGPPGRGPAATAVAAGGPARARRRSARVPASVVHPSTGASSHGANSATNGAPTPAKRHDALAVEVGLAPPGEPTPGRCGVELGPLHRRHDQLPVGLATSHQRISRPVQRHTHRPSRRRRPSSRCGDGHEHSQAPTTDTPIGWNPFVHTG